MSARVVTLAAFLVAVAAFIPAGVATPPPNPLPCTNVDTSNPHFYSAYVAGGTRVYSTNGVPAGCDQVGSDGDNEQGVGGAQMPIIGATCPYSQGAITVGHHWDDIYVTNVANIDVTWTSGVDGQDPAATLFGQTCTGNGVVSGDATTDPADCYDAGGANINLLGSVHDDTDPLSIGTNSATSGFTCLDAVDGNEWTFLTSGPYTAGQSPVVVDPACATDGHPCVTVYVPGQFGVSTPIRGTIASDVEVD